MTTNLANQSFVKNPSIKIGSAEIVFTSEEQARAFRRCLKIVRVEAKIERRGQTVAFCIRPKNPNSLKDALINRGINNSIAIEVCDFLNYNPNEWIRFVSQSRV
jgi:hypothetical protein